MESASPADQLARGTSERVPFSTSPVAASAANLTPEREGRARAHLSIKPLFDEEPSEPKGRGSFPGGGGGINKELKEHRRCDHNQPHFPQFPSRVR